MPPNLNHMSSISLPKHHLSQRPEPPSGLGLDTIDSATKFLFGQSVGTLKQNKQGPDFAEAFCYAQSNIVVRATLGPLKALYGDAKADECHRICRGFAQPFVDEAFRADATKKAIQG
jgi:hypothetical protein